MEAVVITMLLRFNPMYRKLNDCFRSAGIFKTRRGYEVLPIIHAIERKDGYTAMTFTLPNGVDPKLVEKREYAFQQTFGTNTVVHGGPKKFVIHVYERQMPNKLIYRWPEVSVACGGLSLPIITGVRADGKLFAYDMFVHPHLLIAGETGSGKSTQLRAILTTLIRLKSPHMLRFVLADMKRSEFGLFRNIAHVDALCNDNDALALALSDVRRELTKRGNLLDQCGKVNIADLPPGKRPPGIIVCIDEVAMLHGDKESMELLEDISALGRALGVYLILSMQRPDADVLDGKLKANLTVRMAFEHADAINSKITLGAKGAENLDVTGRMLLKIKRPELVQAPLLTDDAAIKLLTPYYREPSVKQPKAINNPPSPFGTLDEKGGNELD
jgi:S-DNA-T family DNA segregation ATPase FtsK/SpoIIIE